MGYRQPDEWDAACTASRRHALVSCVSDPAIALAASVVVPMRMLVGMPVLVSW